jgi:hypothetical protein
MPSPKKITANQRNARRSTGPRTDAGKAQSRLNAFRHGLAIPSAALPELASDVAHLTQAIAGAAADAPLVRDAALRVAEAALDVLRARHARTLPLARQRGWDWDQLGTLDRYERRALSRRNKAIRILEEVQASAPGTDFSIWQNEPKIDVRAPPPSPLPLWERSPRRGG